MSSPNPKIIVIITSNGIESISVHASNYEGRCTGYETCKALEPVFANLNQVIREIYQRSDEERVN